VANLDPKAKRMLELGQELPYAPQDNPDWAMKAALGIAHNLTTRTGIRDQFNQLQQLVRQDLLGTFAAIIRAAKDIEQTPALATEPAVSVFLPTPKPEVASSKKGASGEAADPVEIWTLQLSKWRVARDNGIDTLDITAKSGVSAFAPDFNNVMAYKRNELTEDEYTVRYLERMEMTRREAPQVWATLKDCKRVALLCYCRKDQFCHRHIFSHLMKNYLAEHDIPSVLHGELPTD